MLLIGTDHGDMLDMQEYRKDQLHTNVPKGIFTPFGWTVTGDVWPVMGGDDDRPSSHLSFA